VNGANEVNLMQLTFSAGAGGSLQIGEPRKIMHFQSRVILPQNNQFAYSPHPDGKRFLVNVRPIDASSEINVITNWQKLSGSAKP
jgi:hypothetical protein